MTETYSPECDVCKAAKEARAKGDLDNDALTPIATKYIVPLPLLRRRLRLPGSKKIWDDAQIEKFKELAGSGKTNAAIAEELGVSASAIPSLAKKFDVDLTLSRRKGKVSIARRISDLGDVITGNLENDGSLDAESVTAWANTGGFETDVEEVERVARLLGLEFGDKRVMPPAKKKKGTPSNPPAERDVSDVDLPTEVQVTLDDLVEVDRESLRWVKRYYAERPKGNIEDYMIWAESHPEAPTSTEVRRITGGWGEAKRLAESLS